MLSLIAHQNAMKQADAHSSSQVNLAQARATTGCDATRAVLSSCSDTHVRPTVLLTQTFCSNLGGSTGAALRGSISSLIGRLTALKELYFIWNRISWWGPCQLQLGKWLHWSGVRIAILQFGSHAYNHIFQCTSRTTTSTAHCRPSWAS